MPTRYTIEIEGLKSVVSADTFKEITLREDAKKTGTYFRSPIFYSKSISY
jgi:hypothetical protein